MPPVTLYLDTARLGQMSPTAQRLSTAFIRLSAEEPFNLYCEQFLREGFESWPGRYRRRFLGLRAWRGIEQLREDIRRLAGASEGASVLLSSRSLSLVKAAATVLFRQCRRLLTTDLSWASYQRELVQEADRQGRQLFTFPVRHDILGGRLTADELAETLAEEFLRRKCDSLFLPAVDNLGIRVPIPQIVRRIESCSPIRFVLTDAAQALAHIPLAEVCHSSDFVIAGCHKWVRGYYPLGIAINGERRRIPACRGPGPRGTELNEAIVTGDPLAGFLENLETGRFAQHLETVNLGPLFSAQGALRDMQSLDLHSVCERQRTSARELLQIAWDVGCEPLAMDASLQSGIQLYRCHLAQPSLDLKALTIERLLMRGGIVATAYDGGLLRFSLPIRFLTVIELRRIRAGLIAAFSTTPRKARFARSRPALRR